jgi:hypothetical protein
MIEKHVEDGTLAMTVHVHRHWTAEPALKAPRAVKNCLNWFSVKKIEMKQ